jgi:hypothetical protein
MGYRAKKEKTEKAEPGCTEPACTDCPSECEGSEG